MTAIILTACAAAAVLIYRGIRPLLQRAGII